MLRTRWLLAILLLVSQPVSAYNQTKESPKYDSLTVQSQKACGDGTTRAELGKGIMYVGTSVAITGAALLVMGSVSHMYKHNDGLNGESLTIGIIGGLISLIGLPIYYSGCNKMNINGVDFQNVNTEFNPHSGGIIEIGLGAPRGVFSIDGMYGYNFTRNIIVGGGIGLRTTPNTSDQMISLTAIPIYGQSRFSFGQQRTSMYLSFNLGYEPINKGLYTGINSGCMIRSKINNSSFMVGTSAELIGAEHLFLSLKISKAF